MRDEASSDTSLSRPFCSVGKGDGPVPVPAAWAGPALAALAEASAAAAANLSLSRSASARKRSFSSRCWFKILSTWKPRFLSAIRGVVRILGNQLTQVHADRVMGSSYTHEWKSKASSAFGLFNKTLQRADAIL